MWPLNQCLADMSYIDLLLYGFWEPWTPHLSQSDQGKCSRLSGWRSSFLVGYKKMLFAEQLSLCLCASSENNEVIAKKWLYIFRRKLDVRLVFPNSLEAWKYQALGKISRFSFSWLFHLNLEITQLWSISENYLLWKAVSQSLKNISTLHLKNCLWSSKNIWIGNQILKITSFAEKTWVLCVCLCLVYLFYLSLFR